MTSGRVLTKDGLSLGIENFPDRKKPAVCITKPGENAVHVLGYLRDDKAAEAFMDTLTKICGLSGK